MVPNTATDDYVILLTRPLTEAQELARALLQEHYKVLIDPLLHIRPLECASLEVHLPQAWVATSMNGIRRLAQLTSNREISLYTVGEISAGEAQKLGFENVYGAQGSVTSLIDLVQKNLHPSKGKILYLSGREIKGDIVKNLSSKGFDIERLVVYEALAAQSLQAETKEALITGRLKAIWFFSPRTGEIFVDLAQMYAQAFQNIVAVCLSEEVAGPLKKFKWQHVLIASEKSGRSMLNSLSHYFHHQKGIKF